MPETRPFIVRAWPMNMAMPPQDERWLTLDQAIDAAWRLAAGDQHYRSTQVLDDNAMRWAEFGPVWQATIDQ